MNIMKFSFPIIASIMLSLAGCIMNDDLTPDPDDAIAPVANFTYAGANLPAPATISFTNTSTDANFSDWDFGDNATSTARNPTHTYATGGVYTVRLTATGQGGSNTITKTVNIQAAPTICRITSIKLTAMPFTDPNGTGWDSFDGPDVFYKIANNAGTVLVDGTTLRVNDIALSNLPITWNLAPAVTITPLTSNVFGIFIYDYDTFDADDYIGGVGFNPITSVNGYPSTVTLTNQGVSIILGLQWQ
jgi:PKD repeat protein